MDNAVVPLNANGNPGALTPAPGLVERVAALPAGTKMKLGAGLAALVAIVVSILLWANQGDWRVLYANLPDKDAGAILAQLSQMNVPYRQAEGGAALLVPADKVYEVRLKLAQAGLPKSSVVGFEIMDNPRFGQTQQQERVSLQRALEGELTRTITALQGVQDARVHLALPNQSGFFREQQKPSASVMLTLQPGTRLDKAQIAGIVHLVSSSQSELSPKAVSVIDQTGDLLTATDEATEGLDSNQLQYLAQVEAKYQKRVMELLEPVVGADNLRASVTAELDFAQSEATLEQYAPNQGDQAPSIRSQQTLESTLPATPQPTGVPGATSNQPPVPATAPISGASAPLQAAQGGTTGGGSRKEAVTNFELGKTVRVVRNATGTVRRLNAAVVVNNHVATDAKGKVSNTPLPPEEIERLTSLVQEAIGYNKERGDSVKVVNAPFKPVTVPKVDELPLWKQPWLLDLLRAAAVPAALALVGMAVVFGMVKPALKNAYLPPETPETAKLDAVVDDVEALPGADGLPALEAPKQNMKLEDAKRLARENPGAVANIMREWANGGQAI